MHYPRSILLTLVPTLVSRVTASPLAVPDAVAAPEPCATGVHMIITRGTGDQSFKNQGAQHVIAENVISRIPGSDVVGLAYPDDTGDPEYYHSESTGVVNLNKSITDYATRCPSTRIVLLGYSQGAEVTMDVLCGTSSQNFTATDPIPAQFDSHIESVIVMGDPTHVPGTSYDVGTSTTAGIFPRRNLNGCIPFRSRIQSYCDVGDKFCASSNPSYKRVHTGYVKEYGSQAADYIVSMHK